MHQYIKFNTGFITALYLVLFLMSACVKKEVLDPSNADGKTFTLKDDSDDPVDKSIYKFYSSTGIPSYYNDTIERKLISKEEEENTRFHYKKLALTYNVGPYSPAGFKYISNKEVIPEFLKFFEERVIPKMKSPDQVYSIFFVDSMWTIYNIQNSEFLHGFTAMFGMTTMGVMTKDVTVMDEENKEKYAASILGGIAFKSLTVNFETRLQKEFYSVSRNASKSVLSFDLYFPYPLMYFVTPDKMPNPHDWGLFHFTEVLVSGLGLLEYTPSTEWDLRAFSSAAFYYSSEAFSSKYAGFPNMINKFGAIRAILLEVGFSLP